MIDIQLFKKAPLRTAAPLLPVLLSAALVPFNAGAVGLVMIFVLLGVGILYAFNAYFSALTLPVVGAATLLAWLCVGFFVGGPVFLRAAAAACCVVLPSLTVQAWTAFLSLFDRELKLWDADTSAPITKAVLFLDTRSVAMRIAKPYAGGILAEAPLIAPAHMPLGEVFAHFLDDEESNRRHILPAGKLAWSFHTARLGQFRYLDPGLSLQQNRVPANAVITATAFDVTPFLPNTPNNPL